MICARASTFLGEGQEAAQYKLAYAIAKDRVYPERQKSSSKGRRERWWRYTSPADDLYEAISGFNRVLVTCFTSKFICFTFMPSDMIFSNAVIVVASQQNTDFAILQSNFHEPWVREHSSTLETRQRYALSDCYETFPPPSNRQLLDQIGGEYHELRSKIMKQAQCGLTELYNRFHDSHEPEDNIKKLRLVQIKMDNAVAAAYGWTRLDLCHGFHGTRQGVRYTISEPARREVLARLLNLNHERYAEEVRQGLHDKKKAKPAKSKKSNPDPDQGPGLFDQEADA